MYIVHEIQQEKKKKRGRIHGVRCYETPFSPVEEKALRTDGRTYGQTLPKRYLVAFKMKRKIWNLDGPGSWVTIFFCRSCSSRFHLILLSDPCLLPRSSRNLRWGNGPDYDVRHARQARHRQLSRTCVTWRRSLMIASSIANVFNASSFISELRKVEMMIAFPCIKWKWELRKWYFADFAFDEFGFNKICPFWSIHFFL